MFEESLQFFWISILSLVGIFYVVLIAVYIFIAISLTHMASKRGVPYVQFAWLPLLNLYLVCELIGNRAFFGSITFKRVKVYSMAIVIMGCIFSKWTGILGEWIDIGALNGITVMFSLLAWSFIILCIGNLYRVYSAKEPARYMFTSFFLPFMIPVYLYKIRNNEPVFFEGFEYSTNEKEFNDRSVATLVLGICSLLSLSTGIGAVSIIVSAITLYFGLSVISLAKSTEGVEVPAYVYVGVVLSGLAFFIVLSILALFILGVMCAGEAEYYKRRRWWY